MKFNAKKLQELMKKSYLTFSQLHKLLIKENHDITEVSLRNWVDGKSAPTYENVAMLSKFFNVPMEHFLEN